MSKRNTLAAKAARREARELRHEHREEFENWRVKLAYCTMCNRGPREVYIPGDICQRCLNQMVIDELGGDDDGS